MKPQIMGDYGAIFPLVGWTRQQIENIDMEINTQLVLQRMEWLICVYTCSQLEFVQKFIATEPHVHSFYALHAVVLHTRNSEYMKQWHTLEKIALRKKLRAHDAQLKAIAKYHAISISRAKNSSYFKFPHNTRNIYTDDFSKDMVQHAFPGWTKFHYRAHIPESAVDAVVETFTAAKREDGPTKRARIEAARPLLLQN